MNNETLRIFVAEGCGPCGSLKDQLDSGQLVIEGVRAQTPIEVVDVTTDEGYDAVSKYNLDAIPSAYLEEQRCRIYRDPEDGTLIIACGEGQLRDASLEEVPSEELSAPDDQSSPVPADESMKDSAHQLA